MAARGKRSTGPATKMKTDVLLKNRTFLIKNLHIDEVLELLYQERKIAKTEYESINEKRPRSKRVKKLLDVLDTKDDTAYDVFRKGLEEGDCDQDFIIRKLDETEQTTISTKLVPKPSKNRYKLVLLGTAGVGKTNLMTVYNGGKFLVGSTTTVGTDFVSKNVTVDTGNECEESQVSVQIWDTAGQETYCAMSRMVYRDAQGVIFVYDICNRVSFEKLDFFLSEFRQYNSRSDRAVMMLVGNKRDLIGKQTYKREVTPEEAHGYAEERGLHFIHETSAATQENVEKVFKILVNEIYNRNPGSGLTQNDDSVVSLTDVRLKHKKKCPCLRGEAD